MENIPLVYLYMDYMLKYYFGYIGLNKVYY